MEEKYNVLVVGAGKIGAFFDNPDSLNIITHANAFTKNKGFNFVGFVDNNYESSCNAAKIWNTLSFKSIEEAFLKNRIDVVTIAVPDEFHYCTLKEVLGYNPKVILLEKPITKTIKEAKDILDMLNKSSSHILVNYSRRFISEYELIKQEISSNQYGNFITGTCYYGKGVLHNGSHAVDLIRYLLGDIKHIKSEEAIFDFYRDDPSISGEVTLNNNRKIHLNAIDCNDFTVFDFDLIFQKGRIKFEDSDFLKIEKFIVEENHVLKGYKNLIKNYNFIQEYDVAMKNAVINIYNHISEGEQLKCTFQDGYEALKLCLELSNY